MNVNLTQPCIDAKPRACFLYAWRVYALLVMGVYGAFATVTTFAQSPDNAKSNVFVLPKRLPIAKSPQRLASKEGRPSSETLDNERSYPYELPQLGSSVTSPNALLPLPKGLPAESSSRSLPHRLAPAPSQPSNQALLLPASPGGAVSRSLPARLASNRRPLKSFENQPNLVPPITRLPTSQSPDGDASEAVPERIPGPRKEGASVSPQFEPWRPPSLFRARTHGTSTLPTFDAGLIEQNQAFNERPPLYQISHRLGQVIQASGDSAQDEQVGASGMRLGEPYGRHQLVTHQEPGAGAALVDRSLCPSIPWDHADDFSPTPLPVDELFHDSVAEQSVYDDKRPVPTQRPWIEWGRKFYGSGITPPSETWMGETNLVQQQLYLYGDYRTGIATGRNDFGRIDNWASRLNLDLDYRVTATERFHAFFGPLNRATQFSRMEYVNDEFEYQSFYNLNPVTAFFEGDLGAIFGGATGTSSPMELPVTAGLVPLVFQNGIWIEDAVSGVAFALPARHSRALNWANFDATFFAVFDQINSPAFGADNHAAQAFGTGWFIDAYDGYIETGYAYLNDRADLGRSYHNMTASFTRRYFDKISNSVRVIVNAGQDLEKDQRTADGTLLLIENSLVSHEPLTVIPYFNFFAGWDRPQSVARAGVSGGVLRNTGMNFEIDGLNGYPTLDATAADTAGGSIGVDLIGDDFDRQLLLEASYVTPHGDRSFITGDQYALGTRYQVAISHRSIIRFDTMYGWERGDQDIYGSRIEYRWKF